MLNRIFSWLNRNKPVEQPEFAPLHVRPNGSVYVNFDEVLASKRGQELLRVFNCSQKSSIICCNVI